LRNFFFRYMTSDTSFHLVLCDEQMSGVKQPKNGKKRERQKLKPDGFAKRQSEYESLNKSSFLDDGNLCFQNIRSGWRHTSGTQNGCI
jgi:hypothetical protein